MKNINFDITYSKYYGKVYQLSKAFSKSTGIDSREFESLLNEEFYFAIKDFNPNLSQNLSKWLNHRLKNRLIDFLRSSYVKETSRWFYYETPDSNGDSEETYNIHEPVSDVNIEEDYIRKTNDDKRQLIDELVKDADSLTTAIVFEYLNWTSSERLTPTAIGRKLGIHHEVVKRRLKRLAKRYDERQFGSIDAYLAV